MVVKFKYFVIFIVVSSLAYELFGDTLNQNVLFLPFHIAVNDILLSDNVVKVMQPV